MHSAHKLNGQEKIPCSLARWMTTPVAESKTSASPRAMADSEKPFIGWKRAWREVNANGYAPCPSANDIPQQRRYFQASTVYLSYKIYTIFRKNSVIDAISSGLATSNRE